MTTAGERPGTTVRQEFIAPAQILDDPELPVCLVGRALQLEEDSDAGDYDARTGAANDGAVLEALYPGLILNAVVDISSVSAQFQNTHGLFAVAALDLTPGSPTLDKFTIAADAEITRPIIATASTGSVATSNTLTDLNQKFISSQVQAADVVTFLSGSLNGTTRNVTSVTSQNAIVLDGVAFTVSENNISYKIERTEKAWGTVLVTYEATRRDLDGVLVTILDDDSVEASVGPDNPRNPAGYAVGKARLNANDRKVLFTGVHADTVEEYTRAYEFLESKEIYHKIPLTQEVAILALSPPHVDATSDEASKHERVAWLNRELVVRETKINEAQARTGNFLNASNEQIFTDDAGGAFAFADYVSPGDSIIYDNGGTVVELLIQTVGPDVGIPLTEDQVLINEPGSVNHPGLVNLASDDYTVLSDAKSKTEQAQYLAAYASAFQNRRIVVTWPDVVEVSFNGALQQVPGYFLSAASAGLKSGQKPQQPLTNLAVAGFTKLYNSDSYFNESQLRILDAGGVMVHQQPVEDGPIVVRRQRTTDTTDLRKTELSIVNILDFVAKYMRQELDPYTGKYNITPEYLEMLRVVINGLTARLKETTEVGPVIIEGTLISIEQNAVELDTVDIVYQIEAPVPANYLRVRLQV